MFYKRLNLLLLSVLMLGGCVSETTYQERVNSYCLQNSLRIGLHQQANSLETGQAGGNGAYGNPAEISCFVSSDSE